MEDKTFKQKSKWRKKLLTEIMEADAKDGLYSAVSKMETTQTAVEWLIEQLVFKSDFEHLPNQYFLMSDKNIDKIFEQAKAMEKAQHGNTWDDAIDTHERRGHVIARSLVDFDGYYNETYQSHKD